MCARYELNSPSQKMIERFGLSVPPTVFQDYNQIGEVHPTYSVPVIGPDGSVIMLRWGLDVPWQKQPVINARAETAAGKPTFKPILNRRVLVPASAYFEWRQDGSAKIKTRIAVEDESIFAMAGLHSDDRSVVLTCSPAPGIAHIHNRIPVVLSTALEQDWINPDAYFDDLAPRLGPYGGSLTVSEPPKTKPKHRDLFS